MTADVENTERVVALVRAPDFWLGALHVRPSTCQVISGRAAIDLQPKVMQVLVALTRAQGRAVSRDELLAACWGGAVVGDDSVHRCIARLRRLSQEETPGVFSIITQARVGYRLIVGDVTDFVTSAEATAALDAAAPVARSKMRPRLRGFLLGVAVTLGLGLIGTVIVKSFAPPNGPHLAIAPFEAIGEDSATRNLAKAVADGTLSELGVSGVPAALLARADGTPKGPYLILEGDVQHTSGSARVTLHLFDPVARAVLWSGEVAGARADAALQEAAGLKAADMLTCGLEAFSGSAGLDTQGRTLWLRTCDTWRQHGTLGQAKDAMRGLMQRSPRFAGAFAKFALASVRLLQYQPSALASAARAQARAAALQALRLNPNEADGYVALALLEDEQNWNQQETWLLQGLARQPNSADLADWQSTFLASVGRNEEALEFAQRGLALDHLSPIKTLQLADVFATLGRAPEAAKIGQEAGQRWPDSPDTLAWVFEHTVRTGDRAQLTNLLSNLQSRPPGMSDAEARFWPHLIAAESGDAATRLAAARQLLLLLHERKFTNWLTIFALHALGEDDMLYTELVRIAHDEPRSGIEPGLFDSDTAKLRSQVRFMDLAERFGLVSYWRRSGKWPDFCGEPSIAYDCPVEANKAAQRAGSARR